MNIHADVVTKVTIDQTNGTDTYTMYNSGKMYFSGNVLVIDTIGNGNVAKKSLSVIEKMTFATVEVSSTDEEILLSSSPSLSVSPVPAVDALTIHTSLEGTFSYTIYEMSGKIILEGEAKNGESLNVSNLAQGVYFLKVNNSFLKFSKL